MELSHYQSLFFGYGTALALWLGLARLFPALWPKTKPPTFEHPWREVGWVILAALGTIGIGQLYVHDWLLPASGTWKPLLDAFNQTLIFLPILLVLPLRKQSAVTAWLPQKQIVYRVILGVGIAICAILVFTTVRAGNDSVWTVLSNVYHVQNLPHLVQVLAEDIAIALLFVRLRAAIGLRWSIALVAVLFAAGHIPAMLANGASLAELQSLILDAVLGCSVLAVLYRSADIWWFWGVHFAMDMMQFYTGLQVTG